MDTIIEVKNLVKRYRKAKSNAVDNISFSIHSGTFFALLGPNGAGKTTTISILTTTLSKTSGIVKIAGYDLDRDQSRIRQNIGIIFQNPSLDLNLTAEENIRFHSVLYGLYPFAPSYTFMPQSYKAKLQQLAEILGIQNELFKKIKTFSGGMRRKLEIIRSLIHNPKVLFLDEPTSGLDPLSRKSLWEYLTKVRDEEKITIFLTTHYLEEAESAKQICIIQNGKITVQGPPSDIKKKLVQEFLMLSSNNINKLTRELNKLSLSFSRDGDLIKVDPGPKTVQQIIQSIHTKLTTLKIHTPTLEEAYVEVITQNQTEND